MAHATAFEHETSFEMHHEVPYGHIIQSKRKYFSILASAVAIAALISFALTWAIISSRPVKVTFALPTLQPTPAATATNAATTGQSSLTAAQLKAAIAKSSGGASVFWAGAESGATYTYNHIAAGQDFVRYLPGGQGLSDTAQNYRVIATYAVANAYDTIVAVSKSKTPGVSKINPDGSIIYYAKATPNHVYMAWKNLGYQIEIFDPTPGASLKLATTPGAIKSVI